MFLFFKNTVKKFSDGIWATYQNDLTLQTKLNLPYVSREENLTGFSIYGHDAHFGQVT